MPWTVIYHEEYECQYFRQEVSISHFEKHCPDRATAYTINGLLHVERHLVIVELHDADQALKRDNLNLHFLALGCLTNDLHDVVSLSLTTKVFLDEF